MADALNDPQWKEFITETARVPTMLEPYIKERLQDQEILLMTHIVLGYPAFEACFEIVETNGGCRR